METRERLISEFLIIIVGGLFSVVATTLLAFVCVKMYQTFNTRFSKRIADDVERESRESWEYKDS